MATPSPAPSPSHTLSEPLPLCLGPWPCLYTQTPNWKDGLESKQAHTAAPTQACVGRARSWASSFRGPRSLVRGADCLSGVVHPTVSPCLAMPGPLLTLLQDSTLESRHSWATDPLVHLSGRSCPSQS